MLINLFNWLTKITGWPAQFFCFRTKVHYEDKAAQSRRVKGPAIIISNHTSVFDYAVYLFVFFGRTLRVQMAEVLFEKKPLGWFLRALGGIYVNRDSRSFDFIRESEEILRKGGVVGIFPESRIPLKGETTPLAFKPSAAYIALSSGFKIIPVYTNGSYFNLKKRAQVIIGKPINPDDFSDDRLDDKETIDRLNNAMRDKIIELEKKLNGQLGKNEAF